MKINQISITIKYSPIVDLQKNYYDKRAILEADFYPATVFPIPDDGFPEIPRMVIKSKNGHSEISISRIAMTFSVIKFDNGYESDWDKCVAYVENKMKIINNFLNEIIGVNNKFEYCGLIVNLSFDSSGSICKELSSNLLKNNVDNLFDINVRYTFVEDDQYFVNIQLQNQRIYNNVKGNIAGELSKENQKDEVIGVLIDINDRFAFNNDIKYESQISVVSSLINKMSIIIKSKLNILINGGGYKNV